MGYWPPVILADSGWLKQYTVPKEVARYVVVGFLDLRAIVKDCIEPRARPNGKRLPRLRPQVRRDHPLSLSISISGGKETYKDSLSNGERTGNSPT